jgi:hypothetical protein
MQGGTAGNSNPIGQYRIAEDSGVRGRVQRVRLDFITPRLVVRGLTIATLDGGVPAHQLEVTSVIVGSRWRDILATRWIGYLRVSGPAYH